jgi:hypothetical protein
VPAADAARAVSAVGWLALVLAYLALHLALYVLKLRDVPAFSQEATIFGYHFWSAVTVSVLAVLGLLLAPSSANAAVAAAAIAAHGIYSTSFLELWSLAEGGYSLSILRLLKHAHQAGRTVDVATLHAIGAKKKGNRVQGLLKLRLARQHGSLFEATLLGRLAGTVLGGIAWAANLRELG